MTYTLREENSHCLRKGSLKAIRKYTKPEYSALPSCLLTAWPLSVCGFVVTCSLLWIRGRLLPSADLTEQSPRCKTKRQPELGCSVIMGMGCSERLWSLCPWGYSKYDRAACCGWSSLGRELGLGGVETPLQPQRVCDLDQAAARSTFGTPGVTEQAVGSAKTPPLAGGALPGQSLPLPICSHQRPGFAWVLAAGHAPSSGRFLMKCWWLLHQRKKDAKSKE